MQTKHANSTGNDAGNGRLAVAELAWSKKHSDADHHAAGAAPAVPVEREWLETIAKNTMLAGHQDWITPWIGKPKAEFATALKQDVTARSFPA